MILKFFILYFYFIFILTSILGYGYLLANFLNKEILKYNLGYIGILGLLSLVLISYKYDEHPPLNFSYSFQLKIFSIVQEKVRDVFMVTI